MTPTFFVIFFRLMFFGWMNNGNLINFLNRETGHVENLIFLCTFEQNGSIIYKTNRKLCSKKYDKFQDEV